jgi:putative transposase
VLCEVLEVSESGYYQWRKRKPCPFQLEAKHKLEEQVAEAFCGSRQTYGSPRVHAALVQKGMRCSRRKVARLMGEKGLVSLWRRKKRKVCTTGSQHNLPVAPNWLNRDFTATAVDQKWVGDITGGLDIGRLAVPGSVIRGVLPQSSRVGNERDTR